MFHKNYLVQEDEITDETLIITDGKDYHLFKSENILLVQEKFCTRENIINASLQDIYSQDWFRYNRHFNTKLVQRIQPHLYNKSTNIHIKMYMDVLADENQAVHSKYLYTIILSAINLYKYAGLMKQGSLSIEKERIQKVLQALNYGRFRNTEFNSVMKTFCGTRFVKRFNEEKIELISSKELYDGTTIYHGCTLHKAKNFTINDFKKLGVELLFASPTFENQINSIQYTTTLKRVGQALGLKPCTINYHTRNFLKMVKFQFITKEEHDYLQEMRKEDKSFPYSFTIYSNQKSLFYDENGEFQKNSQYYLAPIGSKLFTNKKFNSFHRTGPEVFDSINYLEFQSRFDESKTTFVQLTNEFNLVSLMDSVERKKNSPEYTSNDSAESSNAFEIDYNKQIQIVYKNYNVVKASLQQLVAILGMIKNLSASEINLAEFKWNQKLYKLDKLIRFFTKAVISTQSIDEETLYKNIRTFGLIMDRTRAIQNSKRHIKKFIRNQRDTLITNQRYNDRIKYRWSPEVGSKAMNELFSFILENNQSAVATGLSKSELLVPSESFNSSIDNFPINNNLLHNKDKIIGN